MAHTYALHKIGAARKHWMSCLLRIVGIGDVKRSRLTLLIQFVYGHRGDRKYYNTKTGFLLSYFFHNYITITFVYQ